MPRSGGSRADLVSRLVRRRKVAVHPREGYDRWAPTYGEPPNAFQHLEHDALQRVLPDPNGHAVLDVGCGRGRIAQLCLERGARQVVGVDLSAAMLARCPQPARLLRAAAHLDALPLDQGSFDGAVAALCLGHVSALAVAIAEISRTLRPGGWLVISDFHPFATLAGMERTFRDPRRDRVLAIEQHAHLFSDYVAALREADLTVEDLVEPRWEGSPIAFVLTALKRVEKPAQVDHGATS